MTAGDVAVAEGKSSFVVSAQTRTRPAHPFTDESVAFADVFHHIDPALLDIYAAACYDTNEHPSVSGARQFREAVRFQNPQFLSQPSEAQSGQSETEKAPRQDASLSLRSLCLGTASASCLALQFKGRNYTKLDLSDNQLSDLSSAAICGIIHGLPKLKWLMLSGNLLGPIGWSEIGKELEVDRKLEGLALGESQQLSVPSAHPPRALRPANVGADGLRILLNALKKNKHRALSSLMLCRCGLGADSGPILADYMQEDELLRHLDVSCNPLSSEGVSALLPCCTRIEHLDLSDTGCRGELIHTQLCTLVQNSKHLSHLSMAYNTLGTRPLRRLARAVAACTSLTCLNLAGTSMDTDGITALADALLCSDAHNLKELDLSENQFTEVEAMTALSHAIHGTGLQILKLNKNALGDAGISELGDALHPENFPPDGPALTTLEVVSCKIGVAGAEHLLGCIRLNKSLMTLKLTDNFLDGALDISCIESLKYLQDLRLDSNRLPRKTIQRAAQACSRNKQRVDDKEPRSLRKEVQRLKVQEIKLAQARKQAARDEAEIFVRKDSRYNYAEDLRHFRATVLKASRQAQSKINDLESALNSRRLYLQHVKTAIVETAKNNEREISNLKAELASRESSLAEIQGQLSEVDGELARRKAEHPCEVAEIKAKIKAAGEGADRLKATATDARGQLKAIQDKSLIDFKP